MQRIILLSCSVFITFGLFAQGPYAPPAGQSGSTAIHKDSSIVVAWASGCTINRGLQDLSNPALGNATVGSDADAIGKSGEHGIVSLGDGGSAVLTFDAPIKNGTGPDFAVFENSFDGLFLELAFVEVSSDGVHYFRFDAISLTPTTTQTLGFEYTDATNLYNLAGKYQSGYGTPFDLDELTGINGLDINNITHLKIIDVVGSIDPLYATYDSQNNIVNDPFQTAFPSSGFDLDAVAVIHSSATKVTEINAEKLMRIYPTPTKDIVNIELFENIQFQYQVLNVTGNVVLEGECESHNNRLDLSGLESGVYFLQLFSNQLTTTKRLIKQ